MASMDYGKRLLDVSNASVGAYGRGGGMDNQSTTLGAINERPISAFYKNGANQG